MLYLPLFLYSFLPFYLIRDYRSYRTLRALRGSQLRRFVALSFPLPLPLCSYTLFGVCVNDVFTNNDKEIKNEGWNSHDRPVEWDAV